MVRSMAETFRVGTRIALAWTRPVSCGSRRSTPRARPVDTGMIDCIAERVRRRSVVVVTVDQRLVVHYRVQRGQQRLLDADLAVEQGEQRHYALVVQEAAETMRRCRSAKFG
jgi:hypothetical protein